MVMQFRRPEKSWTAVVRGAVVCGIEKLGNKSLKHTNPCRHSYGVCLDEMYRSTHHSPQDAVQVGGSTFVQGQLDWLLNKDDLVLFGETLKREKTIHIRLGTFRQDVLPLTIWQNLTDEEYRPTRFEDASDGR
jgi:hypothetical protein